MYCGQRKSKTKRQLTPWTRILFERPTVPELVKNFPALCETRWFSTAFTIAAICPYPEVDHSMFPIPLVKGQF